MKTADRIEELSLALLGRPATKWEKDEFTEHTRATSRSTASPSRTFLGDAEFTEFLSSTRGAPRL
jgi:hypothetical protein